MRGRHAIGPLLLALTCVAINAMGFCPGAAAAAVQAPWWRLASSSAPSILKPGDKEDVVFAAVSNLGDAPADGSTSPITITDRLPAGLTATSIHLISSSERQEGTCEPAPVLHCTFTQEVQPYVRLEARITVEVASDLPAQEMDNEIEVQGGGAPTTSSTGPLKVADEPTRFGVQAVELAPEGETGAPDPIAGSHPFQLTTTLDFNQTLEPGDGTEPNAPALVKNLHFDLPPGLIGNPQATPQCSNVDFSTLLGQGTNLCPGDTAVGAAVVTINEPADTGYISVTVPLFNLAPAPGEPARFGFEALNVPVVLDTAVMTGGDYSVQVNVSNATSVAQVLGSQISFWGEPGDVRHDQARGWGCIDGGREAVEGERCETPSPRPTVPLLRLPTSCEGPLTATLTGDSWSGETLEGSAGIPALSDCGDLHFGPSIGVDTEQHTSSTPSGFRIDVKVPQPGLLEGDGPPESDVRDTTVTLPEGVEMSPSAANGLQACTEQQAGLLGVNPQTQVDEFTSAAVSCPEASKLGLVRIRTPLLAHELQGALYLATPAPSGEGGKNPFDSLAAVYLVAEEPTSRVLVKLAGEVALDEGNLQATTTFRDTPQVPFEELEIELFGGPRAALTTPPLCGEYHLSGSMTPWSGTGPVGISTAPGELSIGAGPGGASCPGGQLPFAPSFLAQSTSLQAGGFTGFTMSIGRPDGEQAIGAVSVHLPPGVAALLSSVTPCPEPQASQGTCGPASLIGYTTVSAGLGPEPVTPPEGEVFITGRYGNAPYGLSIVAPAVAGPFDLGNVIVRSAINVDPNNASVTITSDPIPTELRGIPLQLGQINVIIDRPGFEFNPTSCNPTSITGLLSGAGGASEPVSSPFQVAGCPALPFAPKLTASVGGHASKADGTGFDVRIQSSGLGQANIARVDLQLPTSLPTRQPTLNKACRDTVFDVSPAQCSPESIIGGATIHTPVLAGPLSGPAYLVSHGGAEFPDVEFVLQGEGITLVLDGKTDIEHGITYSRFETAPDAPFTSFEAQLPAGPHSILSAYAPGTSHLDLCAARLEMPTEITSQSAVTIRQTTSITATGCPPPAPAHRASRAQLLAKALAACRARYRHSRSRRASCEAQARRRYAPPAHPKTGKAARGSHGESSLIAALGRLHLRASRPPSAR